ncbi:uncharacterized protein LOC110117727 [Ceratitis capitata]|uniref:uncharacterized protein LOC110117727 n=1 Tax=Ceratitis capitata TaxID=7213 RepID=UPI000A104E56|nr:uncharacterized protein LOC110117727 [Ceratitis capitata]
MIGPYQYGLIPGKFTIDQIFIMHQTLEKTREKSINTNNLLIDLRSTLDILNLSGLSSEFNIHLSPCIHHCTCWLNLTSNDCSNTCQFDESSCLKQKFSTCNLDDFSIKYNESGVVETYLCKNREKSKADTGSKLIIILGSAFICIMLITIGYLCMRIYQTRHETGAHEIPISLLMKF